MPSRIIPIIVLALASSTASAEAIKAYLGSEAARFSYATEAFGQQFGRLETEFGVLFTDHDEAVREDDFLTHVGLQVRGESLDFPVIVSVGGRAYYGEASSYDISGIGIGGDMLMLPESWGGFGLGAFFYYAPGVVSFQDAEKLREWGLFASFQITPQASIVAGIQNIEADIETAPGVTSSVEIEDGSFFGIDIRF
ncbi:MAG: hypothetical protein SV201_01770 [Pseudomonadota bacterium]|nr:hypothetical protein [Pseudomonadota bacterium]